MAAVLLSIGSSMATAAVSSAAAASSLSDAATSSVATDSGDGVHDARSALVNEALWRRNLLIWGRILKNCATHHCKCVNRAT